MNENKIILGNAYELIKELPDKSVDLIYTDIPYIIEKGGAGSCGYKMKKLKADLESRQDITNGIDCSIFDEFCRVLKHIYIYIYGAVKSKYMIFLTTL